LHWLCAEYLGVRHTAQCGPSLTLYRRYDWPICPSALSCTLAGGVECCRAHSHRIAIAYTNRSVLLILKEHAGIDTNELSWAQRAARLPVAVLYRALSGIATLIGGLALAISFRLFNREVPFGTSELWSHVEALASGITYATLGAMVLFALYGVAVAI